MAVLKYIAKNNLLKLIFNNNLKYVNNVNIEILD